MEVTTLLLILLFMKSVLITILCYSWEGGRRRICELERELTHFRESPIGKTLVYGNTFREPIRPGD